MQGKKHRLHAVEAQDFSSIESMIVKAELGIQKLPAAKAIYMVQRSYLVNYALKCKISELNPQRPSSIVSGAIYAQVPIDSTVMFVLSAAINFPRPGSENG